MIGPTVKDSTMKGFVVLRNTEVCLTYLICFQLHEKYGEVVPVKKKRKSQHENEDINQLERSRNEASEEINEGNKAMAVVAKRGSCTMQGRSY